MEKRGYQTPPRWFFSIISTGAFIACGIYVGMIHAGDMSTPHVIRAVACGMLGLVMMWGVLGSRNDG